MSQTEAATPLEGQNTSKLQELQTQLLTDLDEADSTFEKNLLKAEYEHKLKLLGLKEEISINNTNENGFECVGCGS